MKALRRIRTTGLVLVLLLWSPLLRAGDDFDDDGPKVELHGFVESATSSRVVDDPTSPNSFLLGEARLRLELSLDTDKVKFMFKGDLIGDAVNEDASIDLRDASITLTLARWLTVKAGRQVLTWGTGDLLFLNDLFPKDFVSFFSGRNDEYLKVPSNAIKITLNLKKINLDLVWMPIFESDRFITGKRLSFYNPNLDTIVGGSEMVIPARPDKHIKNTEGALRLYGRVGGFELALYGFIGFTKQPLAFNPEILRQSFSRLGVYGFSVRGPLLGGILNVEGAFRHSFRDNDGRDPNIPNHQVRALVGYEHELAKKLTLGIQYYLEAILFHDRLKAHSPAPQLEPDELRHVVTLRLNWMLLNDDLQLSLFTMVGITRYVDAYLRPSITWKPVDSVALTFGANVMLGSNDRTFITQLKHNTNVYARLRYTF